MSADLGTMAAVLPLPSRPLVLATPAERRIAPRCEAHVGRTANGARVGRCERRVHFLPSGDDLHVASATAVGRDGALEERWFEWLGPHGDEPLVPRAVAVWP